MHFLDFKLLPVPQQAGLLCKSGVYLAERTEGIFFIALYALHDYYVEVYYRLRDSEVVMLISFYDTALLGPYLKKIKLDSLLAVTQY